MSKKIQKKSGSGKGSLILAAAPVICCGGLLLPALIGSAGFATLTAVFKDPLFQAGAAIAMVLLVAILWRQRRVKRV